MVPSVPDLPELAVVFQHLEHHVRVRSEVLRLVKRERQFMRRTTQMPHHHIGVFGLYHGLLNRPLEDVLRMSHDILVDAGVETDQEHHGIGLFAPRTARLLEEGSSCAGIAHHDARLQAANVNTQLQRGSRADAEEFPFEQTFLNRTALLWQVAPTIGSYLRHLLWRDLKQLVRHIPMDLLCRHLRLGKGDSRYALSHKLRHEFVRFHIGAPT